MRATCPACGVLMDLAGHTAGEVVRCSCNALLFITVDFALDLVPPERPVPRPSLWAQTEQLRQRLAAEVETLPPHTLEALAGQLRRLSEQCSREIYRRRDPDARLRRDP